MTEVQTLTSSYFAQVKARYQELMFKDPEKLDSVIEAVKGSFGFDWRGRDPIHIDED